MGCNQWVRTKGAEMRSEPRCAAACAARRARPHIKQGKRPSGHSRPPPRAESPSRPARGGPRPAHSRPHKPPRPVRPPTPCRLFLLALQPAAASGHRGSAAAGLEPRRTCSARNLPARSSPLAPAPAGSMPACRENKPGCPNARCRSPRRRRHRPPPTAAPRCGCSSRSSWPCAPRLPGPPTMVRRLGQLGSGVLCCPGRLVDCCNQQPAPACTRLPLAGPHRSSPEPTLPPPPQTPCAPRTWSRAATACGPSPPSMQ